jgi:hypothetical protein
VNVTVPVNTDASGDTVYLAGNLSAFSYKFTLGSRNNVEESSGCGYVSNRTSGFNTANVTYTANDTVAAWPGVGGC